MENLHECPFCENTNVELFYWDNGLVWKLRCNVCNTSYTNASKEKLIMFWNSRPKENSLQSNINTLKEELLKIKTSNADSDMSSYTDMRNKRDILQIELNTLKEDMEKITASYITAQNNYNALQKLFDESKLEFEKKIVDLQANFDNEKVIQLRRAEDREAYNVSKIKDAEITIDTLKKEIETLRTSCIDMKNSSNTLQKSFDEYVENSKKENIALQKLLDTEKMKHQSYINTLQTKIDVAEEKLHKTILSYNAKLDSIKLDENKIVGIIEKIKDK